jgi:hypothetical protein
MTLIAILICIWIFCGLAAGRIALAKSGRDHDYNRFFVLGLLLGLVGVLIAYLTPLAPARMRSVRCPRCDARQNVELDEIEYSCWRCHHAVVTER